MTQYSTPNGIRIGHKNTRLVYSYKVYFEKKIVNVDTKEPTWIKRIKYGYNERTNGFKYFKILSPCINEKTTIEERARNMELASKLWQETYISKSLLFNAKFRHYNMVIKPQFLYAAENIARKRLAEIEKREEVFKEI